jgi:hypothetical protein
VIGLFREADVCHFVIAITLLDPGNSAPFFVGILRMQFLDKLMYISRYYYLDFEFVLSHGGD